MRDLGMNNKIIYIPDTEEDIADSYENREPGLGEDFLRSIEACLSIIQRHPRLFPVALDEFRHTPIHLFPFEVFMSLMMKK
ncbi:type II toxin-antitoxin system RelE/ParE family toxin [bacterium]|nr:type II toxin-antitoxin system RelE/ParE family toxin [bacterium]